MIVKAEASSTWAWLFLPTDQVFSVSLVVIASDEWPMFGVLQSSIHREWMWERSTTLKTDDRYPPGPVFGTFPLPRAWEDGLEEISEIFSQRRGEACARREEGVTKVANRIDDPGDTSADIVELRELQSKLDEAVVRSYGWSDLVVRHVHRDVRRKRRFALEEPLAVEIVNRLLQLNRQRHEEDVLQTGSIASRRTDRDTDAVPALPMFPSLDEARQ